MLTTFFAYVLEKRLSRHPERFGHGAIEGVAAPETANNAATVGVMVPLLALGVPPNLAMAMLLGMVLGAMLETNLRQSLLISQGDLGIFVAHPIAATLLALALFVMVTSVLVRLRRQPTPA